MRDELDGTKVTAYALGELDDEERSRVEPLIAGSESALREVAQIKEAAAILHEAFGFEPRHELTPPQRLAIEAAATGPGVAVSPRRRHIPRALRWAAVLAVAAAGALAVVSIMLPSLYRARVPPASDGFTYASPGALTPPPAVRRPQSEGLGQERLEELRSLGYVGGETGAHEVEELRAPSAPFNTESYGHIPEALFVLVAQDPRSTFSVDVDTASYAIVRRFLNAGRLPPRDAVRIEELVNYFPYAYAPPTDGRPFAVHMDTAACPWAPRHLLVRIGIKGREVPRRERPPANLVFLLDVSGSMDAPDKLPLVKAAMRLLVDELDPKDRVAIVVYAGAEGLALPSTPATERTTILSAIEALSPGGTTHGSAGIRLAYETATTHFIKGGINRVILATDGDFNVGVTSPGALVRLIEKKARTGVFLTTLGFGRGNLKDSTLEKLADHGNGNYAYIDGLSEARKVLVEQVGATLVTIAKDVKLQVEFNPRRVQAFRLIGYENRVLAHQDFNDDRRDAGDIGAGHTVTALYEIVPPGVELSLPRVDPLKYQEPPRPIAGPDTGELLTLKLRYKLPDEDRSALMEVPLEESDQAFEEAPPDFRFAAAVAAFGMTLRDSPNRGDASFARVLEWGRSGLGKDRTGARADFLHLVEEAKALSHE
jgi:Ca-activated chloride channel family protein